MHYDRTISLLVIHPIAMHTYDQNKKGYVQRYTYAFKKGYVQCLHGSSIYAYPVASEHVHLQRNE